MAGETLYFPSCEHVDEFFREGRIHFNDVYVEKLAQNSVYWNRVTTEMWPMNSNTTQRAFRLGRGFYDPCNPWKRVISDRCDQNSCDSNPEVIRRPGTESYEFHLLRKEMETEWICVEDLTLRLFPEAEIMHFVKSNAVITRNVQEEFVRANYIGGSGHKWAGYVEADSNIHCGLLDDTAWYLAEYDGEDEGSYNACYVYVKCDPADLVNMSYLSLDMLDDALIELQNEEDAFRLDLMEETGMPLLDIIIPDQKVGRRLYFQAKNNVGNWDANTDFDRKISSRRLGINRVIGDYAFGYDINGLRFNADSVYNASLAAYSEANPATWPRLIRVPRYVREEVELGCVYVPNSREFNNADFGISVAWVPNGLTKWVRPVINGYGEAQMAEQNYSGDWKWRRPDWECNRKRKMGFFEAEFDMAAQVMDPTIMHSFLHRLDKGRILQGACCPLNEGYVPPAQPDCYTCEGAGDVEGED